MLNSIFNFSNKKDRDDFLIAIIVIVFFALLLWWILFKKADSNLQLGNLSPLPPASSLALVPTDTDGDGIVDSLDVCKYIKGLPEFDGCPQNTKLELKGALADAELPKVAIPPSKGLDINAADISAPIVAAKKDSDLDGVYDDVDRCPDLAGVPENDGCPADSDNDGVYDKDDLCPDIAGVPSLGGCPEDSAEKTPETEERLDSDGDGIFDDEDDCPEEAGVAANNGCPDIKIEKEEEDVLEQVKTIQFYYNSARIRTSSKPILEKVADIMNKYPDYRLKIVGHTDDSGSDEANLTLSKSRAQACYNFLASKGINETRMSFDGKGESQPVSSNETAEGRHQNRRVEFILTN